MEDSIFTRIRKKIGRLFGREEAAADQEIPEVQPVEESPQPADGSAGDLSLDDVPPAEPLESRWTEEYVQFLDETDGGLPQSEGEEEEVLWCDMPADREDPESAEAPQEEDSEGPEEKKE